MNPREPKSGERPLSTRNKAFMNSNIASEQDLSVWLCLKGLANCLSSAFIRWGEMWGQWMRFPLCWRRSTKAHKKSVMRFNFTLSKGGTKSGLFVYLYALSFSNWFFLNSLFPTRKKRKTKFCNTFNINYAHQSSYAKNASFPWESKLHFLYLS